MIIFQSSESINELVDGKGGFVAVVVLGEWFKIEGLCARVSFPSK